MRFYFVGKNRHRYLVLVTALSFLLITAALLIVHSSPMTGYEYSVYISTPFIFWVAIIVGLLTGILLFYRYYGTASRMWAIGLFEILLSNMLLVSVYVYRGFIYVDRMDSLSYIGYAKDIVNLGTIPGYNFYPMVSLVMASEGLIIGQSMIILSQLLPATFFTAYTIGMLCWARTISSNPRFVAAMMLAAIPILFAWFVPSLVHETQVVLMLPLFLFILWRGGNGDHRFRILLVAMILFFTLGHPLVAIGVLLFMATIVVGEMLMDKQPRTFSISFILFTFVMLTGWITFNSMLVQNSQVIVEQFLGLMTGISTLGTAQGQASSLGLLSALQSVLVCTIDDIVYMLLSILVGIIILRKGWRTHPLAIVWGCFLVGSIFLGAIVLFTNAHNPFRLINLNFIMIFTVPLVGYLLFSLSGQRKPMKARLISAVIVLCLVTTVFTVYQGPMEVFPNPSVTKTELDGSNWFLTQRSDDLRIYYLQTIPYRYASTIHGENYVIHNPELDENVNETTAHFQSFLQSNYTGETNYLVLSTFDYLGYTVTWAATDKFNVQDFENLRVTTSADMIYTNSGLTIYSRW
jgi:hypothetical protein